MKNLSIIILFSFLATSLISQETSSIKDKLVLDGNIGFQFGDGRTTIGINPQLGYEFTDEILAGVGYSFNSNSYTFLGTTNTQMSHGPTLFGRYLIQPSIFVRADFQSLKYSETSAGDFTIPSFRDERFLIGGGYRKEIKPKIFATAGLFIDLLENGTRPQFRGGIEARL